VTELILVWCLLLAACVGLVARAGQRGTLVLSYFVGLSLIHVPGALNFLGDQMKFVGELETRRGFEVTLYGLAAFLVGVGWSWRPAALGRDRRKAVPTDFHRIGVVLFTVGIVSYFVVAPIASYIPSATSLLSSIGSLLIVGYWAILYDAIMSRDNRRLMLLLAALPVLPLSTLATGGFIGYGIYWMISIVCFVYVVLVRFRWRMLALFPIVCFAGLSLGVAYFSQRGAIREAVWLEEAGVGDRLDRIYRIVENLEPYDWNDPKHVAAIDARLNQNSFVGLGVLRHEMGAIELLYGDSVPWWSLIPRAVWPNKPDVGGGGRLVSQFTGLTFDQSTSFGAGQPLEFYANFGWQGVIGGYLIFGWLLGWLDRGLSRSFHTGDVRGILVYGLPGLSLLQPGGNLLEIVVATVAAAVAARLSYAGLRELRLLPPVVRAPKVAAVP